MSTDHLAQGRPNRRHDRPCHKGPISNTQVPHLRMLFRCAAQPAQFTMHSMKLQSQNARHSNLFMQPYCAAHCRDMAQSGTVTSNAL